jgi:hypothetical protein
MRGLTWFLARGSGPLKLELGNWVYFFTKQISADFIWTRAARVIWRIALRALRIRILRCPPDIWFKELHGKSIARNILLARWEGTFQSIWRAYTTAVVHFLVRLDSQNGCAELFDSAHFLLVKCFIELCEMLSVSTEDSFNIFPCQVLASLSLV